MHSIKHEGRSGKNKCESVIPTYRRTPCLPGQSLRKPSRSNNTTSDIPTLSIGRQRFRKIHNCLPPGTPISRPAPKMAKSNLKRKSVSLVELSSNTKIKTPNKWLSKEHVDEITLPSNPEIKGEISQFKNSREFDIAKKVYTNFVLLAWRRRRTQVQELKILNKKHQNKIDNLQLQTNVLGKLLTCEQERVAKANNNSADISQLLKREKETSKEKTESINRLEAEKWEWRVSRAQMASQIQYLSDKLDLEIAKVQDLNGKCALYERKLAVAMENSRILQDKLEMAANQLKNELKMIEDQMKRMRELETQVADLTSAKNILVKQNENKQREIIKFLDQIKSKDQEISNLQQLSKVQEDNVEMLSKELVDKSEEIDSKDSTIKCLERTIVEFECEQEEFQQNLKRARNKVVFEAIKITASLLFPKPSYAII